MVSLTNGGARMASHINDRTAKNVMIKKECDTCFWETIGMACSHKKRNQKQFDEMYSKRECWLKYGKKGKTAEQLEQKASVK